MSPFDQPLLPQSIADREAGPATTASSAVTGLCTGDFHDRWDQARQVASLGAAALADLLTILQDDDQDWEARWFAARTLGDLRQPEVIAGLIETFATTEDDDLRQAVAAALTQIGPPAIAALGQQLAQPALRPIAVQALARIHHPDTIPLLLMAMEDERSPVRATALDALGSYADPLTLPAMEQGLVDPAVPVRLAAIRGLLSLRQHLDHDPMVQHLTPRLHDADHSVAQQAIYGLGRLPSLAATQALLAILQTSTLPTDRQIWAVQALIWQSTAPALDGLIAAWATLGEPVRLALVPRLTTLSPDLRAQATSALVDWLRAVPTTPAHSPLRRHLVLTLGQLGTVNLESTLQALLQDPDSGVRLHAEAALRQLATAPA
ncbi:HEAT repeat domain-containing protein [Nodosilinea sp. E11]|uniref:HEAT repeat domain-containing protein n=1 Tax=Nodosilinea sp. E11 TaxID=3037479 RepID=UPI002934BD66|nr:HEAT repeat domain-containing protein [Nodosilinea sp. E11]WOD40429.1 HEAT repeat domain-containing protein [Nodosilinea sp. E11]